MSKQNRRIRRHNITGELLIEKDDFYVNVYGKRFEPSNVVNKKIRMSEEQRKFLEKGIKLYEMKEHEKELLSQLSALKENIKTEENLIDKKNNLINRRLTKAEFVSLLKKEIANELTYINVNQIDIKIRNNSSYIIIKNKVDLPYYYVKRVTRVKNNHLVIYRKTDEAKLIYESILVNSRAIYNPDGLLFNESIRYENDSVLYVLKANYSFNDYSSSSVHQIIEKMLEKRCLCA